jgi:hypothetical protein
VRLRHRTANSVGCSRAYPIPSPSSVCPAGFSARPGVADGRCSGGRSSRTGSRRRGTFRNGRAGYVRPVRRPGRLPDARFLAQLAPREGYARRACRTAGQAYRSPRRAPRTARLLQVFRLSMPMRQRAARLQRVRNEGRSGHCATTAVPRDALRERAFRYPFPSSHTPLSRRRPRLAGPHTTP